MMNLKNSFDNAKQKIKDNLPVILTSTAAIGSAAVAVYYERKNYNWISNTLYPKGDFSIHLSGKAADKIKSGIPLDVFDGEFYLVTKEMLRDGLEFAKVLTRE